MSSSQEFLTYSLGDFPLQLGGTIPSAHIAYQTFGSSKSPAIIYPSWYSGSLQDNYWLIGEGKALDPAKYFIIVTALFGNGQSSSPSNTPDLKPFPQVTFKDNVTAQHRLVTDQLGIKHAFAPLQCWDGAWVRARPDQHRYQWATQFPDFMDCAIPFCGSAKTSLHNQVFLEGVKSALIAAKGASSGGICATHSYSGSSTWSETEREKGLKALGRVYAGWGFSQAFYREKLYETKLGFKTLEEFMTGFWETWALSKDPENLLTMLFTWQAGDCSNQEPYGGDFEKAMKGIKARMLVLPGQTDLYFPPEDSEYEVKCMAPGVGECIAFPSIWGHWAGGPGQSTEDVKWLDDKLKTLFAEVGIKKL